MSRPLDGVLVVAIEQAIACVFPSLTTAEAIARLEKAGIGTARVNDMAARHIRSCAPATAGLRSTCPPDRCPR